MRTCIYQWEKEELLNTFTAADCVWAIELLQKRLACLTNPVPSDPINTPIEDLNLSIRAYNALRSVKIATIKDLLNYGIDHIYYLRGAGPKTIQEIRLAVDTRMQGAIPTEKASAGK